MKYQPFQPEVPRRGAIQIPKQIGGDKEKNEEKNNRGIVGSGTGSAFGDGSVRRYSGGAIF